MAYNQLEILSIIPARSNSKRIPGKNLRSLCGKPLIAWTIVSSLASPSISRTVVSTDSESIASVAEIWGAEVPALRPPELAEDHVHSFYPALAMLDYLKKAENYVPDIVVMLLPTSPLRTREDIEKAISVYNSCSCDSVISVTKSCPVERIRVIREDGYIGPIVSSEKINFQSQDVGDCYYLNGSIYISSPKVMYREDSFHTKRSLPYIMSKRNSVDIDTWEDFKLVENLINGS